MNTSEYKTQYIQCRRANFDSNYPRHEFESDEKRESAFENDHLMMDMFPMFIEDMEKVADGRPITSDSFIMALMMWESDGNIRPGLFSASRAEIFEAVRDFKPDATSIEAFVNFCLYP